MRPPTGGASIDGGGVVLGLAMLNVILGLAMLLLAGAVGVVVRIMRRNRGDAHMDTESPRSMAARKKPRLLPTSDVDAPELEPEPLAPPGGVPSWEELD